MNEAAWPRLDGGVEVHESAADLDGLWDRFEVFEAMHHRQHICNPMTEVELRETLVGLALQPHDSVLDVACGPGEVLIRAHEIHGVQHSLGFDLSPWMLNHAARRSAERLAGPRPQWILADSSKVTLEPHDAIVCLGAEWIWHGMAGTIAALASLLLPGGRLAYGGPRLHFDADPDTTTALFGRLETADDVEAELSGHGLRVTRRIDPGEAGWEAYLERGESDVAAWARAHPGDRAEQWVRDQAEWRERYEAERSIIGWSVWIAESVGR